MRDDAEGTEVITPRLDNHIRTRRILLKLLDLEVFVKLRIIPNIVTRDEREDLREICDFLNTEYEVYKWRTEKEFIIIVRKGICTTEEFDFFCSSSFILFILE